MKTTAPRKKLFLQYLSPLALLVLLSAPLAAAATPASSASARAAQARTPSETVREFYKLMRERRFREAFALSIYKPAVEGLSEQEFNELRPDFEKMGGAIPEKIEVSGEQISGDTATVFVKIADAGKSDAELEPVALVREAGVWIVGDRDNQQIVRQAGRQFFFEARIQTHHSEVQDVLQRINLAQGIYASQHNNTYGDLAALISAGLVPKDIESPESTGYRFHVTLSKDAKSWTAGAEPVRYGQTGRLSFILDASGIRSADNGGKPLGKQ
ncbi:MAG TPA: hypothetical protein VD861_13650 [Pyrinomonadaceae bacterium]|nr:hypothetical protein [Pyrinomonadaceae bacterium]